MHSTWITPTGSESLVETRKRVEWIEEEVEKLMEWKRRSYDDPNANMAASCEVCGQTKRKQDMAKAGDKLVKDSKGVVSILFYLCHRCYESLGEVPMR